MPATTDPYLAIAFLEKVATTIGCNASRQAKIDEMMRYTKTILGERVAKYAPVTHEGVFDYDSKGRLIGFSLKPIVKEIINQF